MEQEQEWHFEPHTELIKVPTDPRLAERVAFLEGMAVALGGDCITWRYYKQKFNLTGE